MRQRAAFAVALVLALGCGSRRPEEQPAAATPAVDKGNDQGDDDDSGGSLAAGLVGGALSRGRKAGPWAEPQRSKGASADAPHYALLELDGALVELETPSLLGGNGPLELRGVVERLRALAADPNVTAILLRVGDDFSTSMPAAEELSAALATSSKRIACHFETVANAAYLALMGCGELAIAPAGSLTVSGPSAAPLYLKGLLDKLHVETDFLHIGAFKGAAEPLTRTGPSPEMRDTLDAILEGAYTRLVDGIAGGRKLSRDRVVALVDQALFTEVQAKAAGLVDEVADFTAWRDAHTGGTPWIAVPVVDEKPLDLNALLELLGGGASKPKKITAPHVTLLYAVGQVVDGDGGAGGGREKIASRRLAAAVRVAAADDTVKAIVLRIDSPGGSALASDVIWHAVAEAKAKKPVVVSMGGVAASGGYYIACGATKIWALPDTLTGSIGVVGGKIVLGSALANIGVTTVELGRGKRSGIYSPMRRWTDDERSAVEATMRAVYDTFVARVAAGRGKTVPEIEALAQGRVWIGADAKARGLVDELGGLEDALADARRLGQLAPDAPVDVYPPPATIFDVLGGLGFGVSALGLYSELAAALGPRAAATVMHAWQLLQAFQGPSGAGGAGGAGAGGVGGAGGVVQTVLIFPVLFS